MEGDLGIKAEEIKQKVSQLDALLFRPKRKPGPIRDLGLPLMDPPAIQDRPYWVGELLTIIEGRKGQATDPEELMKRDTFGSAEEIVTNGLKLVDNAVHSLSHIKSASSLSLGIVPVFYFYDNGGRYVRSLLYGFLYWMIAGGEEDTLVRKRVFSAHRQAFEKVLIDRKDDSVSGITRKFGSGGRATFPTAQYYNGLLDLLVQHKDAIAVPAFQEDYARLIKKVSEIRGLGADRTEVKSRIFTNKQKTTLWLREWADTAPSRCGICGGLMDLSLPMQTDHIFDVAKGGKTALDNARMTHPFCNNNKPAIDALRDGQQTLVLPTFADPDREGRYNQLDMFKFMTFDE